MGYPKVQYTTNFRDTLDMGVAVIDVVCTAMVVQEIETTQAPNDTIQERYSLTDREGQLYTMKVLTPPEPVKSCYQKATWLKGHDVSAYVLQPVSSTSAARPYVWFYHLLDGVEGLRLDSSLMGIEYSALRLAARELRHAFDQAFPGQSWQDFYDARSKSA